MKFDTVIMGGGLAGLTAAIMLARAGQRVAVATTGQSALHFNSGSMELLGYSPERKPLTHPLEAMAALPADHPYSLIGHERVRSLLPQVKPFFSEAGVSFHGSHERNHWRLSPIGVWKPAWLTLSDYATVDDLTRMPWKKVALVAIKGFLDFYPSFLARGLAKNGIECKTVEITTAALETLRKSTTEMRAANIARVIQSNAGIDGIAQAVNAAIKGMRDVDAVFFPAVVGFDDSGAARRLRDNVAKPLEYIATLSTSVPGVRTQLQLIRHLRMNGGHYLSGDSVKGAHFDVHRLHSLTTANLGENALEAENFIFAAGSFFSHGLKANPERLYEPVLGLDVKAPLNRTEWFHTDIFSPQPYMKYGVAVEGESLRALRDGHPVDNLHVVGAALPGADTLTEASGGGVGILSALHVANLLTSQS